MVAPFLKKNQPYGTYFAVGSIRFHNFARTTPSAAYPTTGVYTSAVYDAGRAPSAWNKISWSATVPAASNLRFQVAVSSSQDGPWNFVGPDGTSSTYFVLSPGTLPAGLVGRFARYQATFTGDGNVTPTLSRTDLLYSGTNASSLRVYSYDAAGNMTRKVVETEGAPTVTEERNNPAWPAGDRINNLNQIKRLDVING